MLHLPAGVEEAAHDRALGHAQNLGHFFVTEAFNLPEEDDGAVMFGKFPKGALDRFGELLAQGGLPGVSIEDRRQQRAIPSDVVVPTDLVVVVEVPRLLVAADMVDGEVHHDAVEPGVEARSPLEILDVPMNLDEGFLDDVPGILFVLHDPKRHRKSPPVVPVVEFPERCPVALLGTPDELSVSFAVRSGFCLVVRSRGLRRPPRRFIHRFLRRSALGTHRGEGFCRGRRLHGHLCSMS